MGRYSAPASSPGWAGAPPGGPPRPLPRLGFRPSGRPRRGPASPLQQQPGWQVSRLGLQRAGWAGRTPPHPGLPPPPPGPPASSPGWAWRPRLGLLRYACPGWAAWLIPGWAGMIRPLLDRDIFPGWACLSTPAGPDYTVPAGPGRDPWPRPDYLPHRPNYISCRPRFTPSGTYSSSSIVYSASCQSWDASRLGLAYPSPSYAGLGTPLGSDRHIYPLLVSLILRRRIRLMTW
jgi:hypothetical protein